MSRPALDPGQQGGVSSDALGPRRWRSRVRLGTPDGTVTVSAVGPTKQASRDALQAKVAERITAFGSTAASTKTLAEVAEEWWTVFSRSERPDSTLRAYESVMRRHLLPEFGDLVVARTVPADLDDRLDAWRTRTGMRTEMLRAVLRHVFAFAVRQRIIDTSPALELSIVRNGRARDPKPSPSPAQWQQVMEAIASWGQRHGTERAETLRDVLATQAALGTRISEVLALRPCDCYLGEEPPVVVLNGALTYEKGRGLFRAAMKTRASRRTLVVPAFIVPILAERIAAAPDPEAPLFPSTAGTWLWPNNLRRDWRSARDGTDLEWVTPHSLRRAVATLVDAELGLEAAAAQLGHTRTSTTRDHYVTRPAMPHQAKEAAAALDRILGAE